MGNKASKSIKRKSAAATATSEGRIPFTVGDEKFETYYKVAGKLEGRTKRPLVALHGGPGFSHDYLIPLADLAAKDRPVIFYDQIGSGRSTTLPDKPLDFWTFDLFMDEVLNVVNYFGIADDFDIIGHSWGGILLNEVAIQRKPPGLKHAIFTNSICDKQAYGQSQFQQGSTLPKWIMETLSKGYQDTPECRAAALAYSKVFQCRLDPQPAEFGVSVDYGFKNINVNTGVGQNGLNTYNCVDRLHEITIPCLVVNGKYDPCADFTLVGYFKNLSRVKWIHFESEHSSHTPMWEDRERYMILLDEFLE